MSTDVWLSRRGEVIRSGPSFLARAVNGVGFVVWRHWYRSLSSAKRGCERWLASQHSQVSPKKRGKR